MMALLKFNSRYFLKSFATSLTFYFILSFYFFLSLYSNVASANSKIAFVHLFEWSWNDVAIECETQLGPMGISAVQVSPPQSVIAGSQWWTRYQPLNYRLESRSGDEKAFSEMVKRCKAVGVDIYVDAVINHMAALNREFPDVPYTEKDFHNCRDGIDYLDEWSIQHCDLVGLNDLKTESEYVRGKIAEYLNHLIDLGVAGFRIDAAKHMPHQDIANIISRLKGKPYIFLEVIGSYREPVKPEHYTYIGDVTEFNFTNTLGYHFKGNEELFQITKINRGLKGWLPSDKAIVFVANHDNQRQNTKNIITHLDGELNHLAHIFMLGWPYGYPRIMSSYAWENHDQGPPTSSRATSCSNGWLCEHRNRKISNMVRFRFETQQDFFVSDFWSNSHHQIAWGRGKSGFVAINREEKKLDQKLKTSMSPGKYCDVLHGDFNHLTGFCSGPIIVVNEDGYVEFNIPPLDAVAIHKGAKLSK